MDTKKLAQMLADEKRWIYKNVVGYDNAIFVVNRITASLANEFVANNPNFDRDKFYKDSDFWN